jgi:Phosphate-selective porin
MLRLRSIGFILGIAAISTGAFAQSSKLDSLAKEVSLLKKQTSVLSNLKVSGYIQTQYQYADTLGAKTFNGGNFANNIDNRFMVRRGRLKFAYDLGFGSAAFQFDATEKGVGIKNAYISLNAPFAKSISLTGGIFDRPFGYAIEYSSSSMEVVERPMVFQNLMPGEQDLGAMLAYKAADDSPLKGLNVKAGLFNGNGINPDVDKYKDFIGKIAYSGLSNDNVYLNLGASLYYGNVYNPTATVYSMTDVNGVSAFQTSSKEVGAKLLRRYVGLDGQFAMKSAIGKTQLVSEYLWGKQPGSSSSSKSPDYAALPTSAAFLRDFAGGYVTLIQQIHKLSVFGRYDWYDPNTKVKGNDVGLSAAGVTATNATDLRLTTTSVGTFYEPNKNLRFTAQYDFNRYEKTDNGKFSVAGLDNNLFTLRIQYKF